MMISENPTNQPNEYDEWEQQPGSQPQREGPKIGFYHLQWTRIPRLAHEADVTTTRWWRSTTTTTDTTNSYKRKAMFFLTTKMAVFGRVADLQKVKEVNSAKTHELID